MIASPKVTIIIPAYNVEKYVLKGLESCINQTYSNLEIIIVDDGSEDNTASIIEKCANRDKRIVFLRQENLGVSSARNNALKHSTGEYSIFLDADDWLELNAIETLIENAKKYNDSFIICSRYIVDENDCFSKMNDDIRNNSEIVRNEEILESFLYRYFYFQSSCYKLFDLNVIRNNNIEFSKDISHGEDGLFVFSYLQHINSVVSLPIPLWNILERHNSASNSDFNNCKLTAIDAAEAMLKFDVSDNVRKIIIKYLVIRAETMYLEACENGVRNNKKALNFVKETLKKHKSVIKFPDTSLKEKVRYYAMVISPFWFIEWIRRATRLIKSIR